MYYCMSSLAGRPDQLALPDMHTEASNREGAGVDQNGSMLQARVQFY